MSIIIFDDSSEKFTYNKKDLFFNEIDLLTAIKSIDKGRIN